MPKPFIYLDHSATTPLRPEVVEAMSPYFGAEYGNPSAIYALGQRARAAVEDSRRTIADILGAAPQEIVFTSCGSESDNLAVRGVALANRHRGHHIITTPIEHHAVGVTCDQLARELAFEITRVPVDEHGLVNPDDVGRALRPDTILISIMYANNEVGTVEPIAEIGQLARARGIVFHTDAVQAGGYLSLDVNALNVDLMSLGAHKFHGPKGVGALYVRRGTHLLPAQTGGGQESGWRAGTENVAYIVGMATALKIAQSQREATNARLRLLRDKLIYGLLESVPNMRLTGHPASRLPGHASFAIHGVDAASLIMALDVEGICASSGSACTAGHIEPSYVLTAMGLPRAWASGALRLTLGYENTEADVERALEVAPRVVERLRAVK